MIRAPPIPAKAKRRWHSERTYSLRSNTAEAFSMLALPDGSTKKLTTDSLVIAPGASFRCSLCPKKTYCVREFKSKINWDTLEASVKGIETILHEIGGYARNVENEDCEQMMADQNYRRKHPKLMENMLLL